MSFDNPLLNMLQQKMSWLSDRQTVLSRNVANSSTPGFVPSDLDPKGFANALTEVTRGSLKVTSGIHLQSRSSEGGAFRAVVKPDSQSSPDGNAVVVEEQMIRIAETQMSYAEAAALYKKIGAMWRTALSSRGSG